jgi:hypothetical protein
MEQSPFCEANSSSASQEITLILWNPKFITVFIRSRPLTLISVNLGVTYTMFKRLMKVSAAFSRRSHCVTLTTTTNHHTISFSEVCVLVARRATLPWPAYVNQNRWQSFCSEALCCSNERPHCDEHATEQHILVVTDHKVSFNKTLCCFRTGHTAHRHEKFIRV